MRVIKNHIRCHSANVWGTSGVRETWDGFQLARERERDENFPSSHPGIRVPARRALVACQRLGHLRPLTLKMTDVEADLEIQLKFAGLSLHETSSGGSHKHFLPLTASLNEPIRTPSISKVLQLIHFSFYTGGNWAKTETFQATATYRWLKKKKKRSPRCTDLQLMMCFFNPLWPRRQNVLRVSKCTLFFDIYNESNGLIL